MSPSARRGLDKLVKVHGFAFAKACSWTVLVYFARRMSPTVCAYVCLGDDRKNIDIGTVSADFMIAPIDLPGAGLDAHGLGFNIELGVTVTPNDAFFAYVLHRAELILEGSAGLVAAAERELEGPVFKFPAQRGGLDAYVRRWQLYRGATEAFDQDPVMADIRLVAKRVAGGKGSVADIRSPWKKLIPRLWKRKELVELLKGFEVNKATIAIFAKNQMEGPDPIGMILSEYSYVEALLGPPPPIPPEYPAPPMTPPAG
jgi:hypothetical protein